jgi:hypothetical protein
MCVAMGNSKSISPFSKLEFMSESSGSNTDANEWSNFVDSIELEIENEEKLGKW